jgi:hypothetical protein
MVEEKKEIEAATKRYTGAGSATQQLEELNKVDEEKKKRQEIEDLRKAGRIQEALALQQRVDLEKRAAEEQKRLDEEKQRIAGEKEKKRNEEKIALAEKVASIEAARDAAETAHASRMQALEEEKQKKQAEAQKAKEELDKQAAEKQKQIDEARRAAELKFRDELAQVEKKTEEEKKKAKEEQKRLDEQEKELEKKFKQEIKALEAEERKLKKEAADEIKAIEQDIKKVKEEAAKVMAESNAKSEASLGRQLGLVRQMVAEYAKLKPPARAAGGPVSGGSAYTVNELGKEAFLSASGRLSMINTPSWGSWRAPSSGVVIPAHLTSQLSIPSGGVNLNRGAGANTRRFSKSASPLASVMAALQRPGGGMTSDQASNISATQAQQAVAIGKLSRAVRDLSNKDWNVKVQVKGAGGTTNYLHTLNTLR